MAFCSAGDLSLYIRKRGDLAALTASNQGLLPDAGNRKEVELKPIMYPHPKEGGLNETIVRCFLGQLGASFRFRVACWEDEAESVLSLTVDALRFLRSQNVIHRDLKPQVRLFARTATLRWS